MAEHQSSIDAAQKVLDEFMAAFNARDIPAFEARHGLQFARYFAAEGDRLATLEHDRLIDIEPHRILVTPRGRFDPVETLEHVLHTVAGRQ